MAWHGRAAQGLKSKQLTQRRRGFENAENSKVLLCVLFSSAPLRELLTQLAVDYFTCCRKKASVRSHDSLAAAAS